MSTPIATDVSTARAGDKGTPLVQTPGPVPLAALTPTQRQLVLALIRASRVGADGDLVLLESEQRPDDIAPEVHS